MASQFSIGDRVAISPACDCWMQGARFGTVEKIGSKYVHVRLSGRMGTDIPGRGGIRRFPIAGDSLESAS